MLMTEKQRPYVSLPDRDVIEDFIMMIGRVSAMRQVLEDLERELQQMLKAHIDAFGSSDKPG